MMTRRMAGKLVSTPKRPNLARCLCHCTQALLCAALLMALPAFAAVEGVVLNGSTGRPQPGVEINMVKLGQGMEPVGSSRSDAAGKFRFSQSVDPGSPILLRGEFEGVTYNQMIPPGSRTGDVRLTVFPTAPAKGTSGAPEQRILLLEPSGGRLIVNEYYIYRNNAQPAVTYVDAKQGTLRFYLPAAANGQVQVNATGPGGMPLRQSADKAGEAGLYKVSFPIKPGETRIDLTYTIPYNSPMKFDVRSAYDWLTTRVAAPQGVTLSGEGMEALPENPQIKASVYGLPEARSYALSISGEGRLSRAEDEQQGGEQGGDSISIVPSAIHGKMWLVLGFGLGILALGFYALYTAGPKTAVASSAPPAHSGRRGAAAAKPPMGPARAKSKRKA